MNQHILYNGTNASALQQMLAESIYTAPPSPESLIPSHALTMHTDDFSEFHAVAYKKDDCWEFSINGVITPETAKSEQKALLMLAKRGLAQVQYRYMEDGNKPIWVIIEDKPAFQHFKMTNRNQGKKLYKYLADVTDQQAMAITLNVKYQHSHMGWLVFRLVVRANRTPKGGWESEMTEDGRQVRWSALPAHQRADRDFVIRWMVQMAKQKVMTILMHAKMAEIWAIPVQIGKYTTQP